jgi:hypothetical protein
MTRQVNSSKSVHSNITEQSISPSTTVQTLPVAHSCSPHEIIPPCPLQRCCSSTIRSSSPLSRRRLLGVTCAAKGGGGASSESVMLHVGSICGKLRWDLRRRIFFRLGGEVPRPGFARRLMLVMKLIDRFGLVGSIATRDFADHGRLIDQSWIIVIGYGARG